MANGLMLVRITAKATPAFVGEVRGIEGVVDAYPVFGRFDVVVFLGGRNFLAVKGVAAKVAKLKGIKTTETLMEGK